MNSAADKPWPKPAYSWYVVGVICFGYVFAFIDRIIVGLLTPAIQADLGINDTEAGLLQGLAFALFYTLFGVPLGWLADRWNRKTLLSIGMTVWSLMTALCGMATSFWPLFLARIGVGVGEATLNPCASSMIGDYFPPKTRSKAFGVYVMGTAVGTALTYMLGGAIILMLQEYDVINVPLLGAMKPWQVTFLLVGLPGMIPALLFMFTVREPERRDLAAKEKGKASLEETRAFMGLNRVTLACLFGGVALVLMSIYGYINWMPTYFLRLHGWNPGQFSVAYGIFGGTAGIISAISAGWVAAWLKDKGFADGTMRACMLGCLGCAVTGTAAPLMPTPELSLAVFCMAGLFANYPSVLSLSAIAEVAPNEMRALVTAIYVLIIGLLSSGIGPFAVGFVTDSIFGDRQMVGFSMAAVTTVSGLLGTALLGYGLKAYRASLSRVTWG